MEKKEMAPVAAKPTDADKTDRSGSSCEHYTSTDTIWSVATYATEKHLNETMLRRDFGLEDGDWYGQPCVCIPWHNSDGTVFRWRVRLAPDENGNKQERWGDIGDGYDGEQGMSSGSHSNANMPLYGSDLIDWDKANAVVLVEGESDVQALHELGIKAVGVPGASTLTEVQAMFLKVLTHAQVYIHDERDGGAKTLLSKASGLLPDALVFSVRDVMPDCKDPCDLIGLGADEARRIMEVAIAGASPIASVTPSLESENAALVRRPSVAIALARHNGKPANTYENLRTVLERDSALAEKFCFDDFSHRIMMRDDRGLLRPYSRDTDGARIRMYLGEEYQMDSIKPAMVEDAIKVVAMERAYNPLLDWYDALPAWDGVDRISTLFRDLLGADNTALNSALAHLFMRAVVARVHRPGTKYDLCIVLKSKQGIGKQKFGMMIAPLGLYFSMTSIKSKDDTLLMQTGVIGEFEELAAMSTRNTGLEAIKAFITRTVDSIRVPYDRDMSNFPRHCVFYGSTNSSQFLHDMTGERRFPVVECGRHLPTRAQLWIPGDEDWEADKMQIHAQALAEWRENESAPLILPFDLEDDMAHAQEKFVSVDDRIGFVEAYLEEKAALNGGEYETYIAEICTQALGMETNAFLGRRAVSDEIAGILVDKLGCESIGSKRFNGVPHKAFRYHSHG